jgi:hypothetical protein
MTAPSPSSEAEKLEELLKEADELDEIATPGPWEIYNSNSWSRIGLHGQYREILWPTAHRIDGHPDLTGRNFDADMAFIIRARTLLPELAAACRGLREERGELWMLLERERKRLSVRISESILRGTDARALKGLCEDLSEIDAVLATKEPGQ